MDEPRNATMSPMSHAFTRLSLLLLAAGACTARNPHAASQQPESCVSSACASPPANLCADPDHLQAFMPRGTCDDSGRCQYASSLLPCPLGCADGRCNQDPCAGVTCSQPPPNACADANTLSVYSPTGTCDASGGCRYSSSSQACASGCSNGHCNGNPCAGITCNQPPATACANASTLTVYSPTGTCDSTGACRYSSSSQACAFGCSNGHCNRDPCAGVTCNQPPAESCVDAFGLEVYSSPGTCSGGACAYSSARQSCAHGCSNGACNPDPCPGLFTCSTGCADVATDASNCGGCGHVCPGGQACQAGSCVCAFPTSLWCGTCVNPMTDANNCGACGERCPAGQICFAERCSCPSDRWLLCGLDCLDGSNDPNNCGACGVACGANGTCSNGKCVCSSGATLCNGTCVDESSDVKNCGACGTGCAPGFSCVGGACTCPSGRAVCLTGCVDLSSDPQNCGACANFCGANTHCAGGTCVPDVRCEYNNSFYSVGAVFPSTDGCNNCFCFADGTVHCNTQSCQCGPLANFCFNGSTCCTHYCSNGTCAFAPGCHADGAACSGPSDCCGGYCNIFGFCGQTARACRSSGASCTDNGQCCSTRCLSASGSAFTCL
jgi:hypothetical protein